MAIKIIDYFYLFFGTLLLFLFPSSEWLENHFINVKPAIYIIFISFIFLNIFNLFKYLNFLLKENLKNLDFLIIISIFIFFIDQGKINFYAISFLTLYFFIDSIYKYTIESKFNTLGLIINCILISGILAASGVYVGLIESVFFETSIFHAYQPPGYPNPTSEIIKKITGFNLSNRISGFQTSTNYSAYVIIACLGVLSLAKYNKSTIIFLKIFFFFALFFTQAKIGFLYVAILLSLKIFANFHQNLKIALITFICFGYLFLTHLTIVEGATEIINTNYYRELAFNLFNFDFYISLFSWLKLISLDYLMSSDISSDGLNGFIGYANNTDPHSLFFSCIFIGGLAFAILLSIKLGLILFNYFFKNSKREIYFSALLCSFIVESIIWDSYDAPIFWLIVLLGSNYQLIFKK